MRIWSLHPGYLDSTGLVACWRETLLAQKVLAGLTVGYRAHPQLTRFRAHPDPGGAVAAYLHGLADEADARGYRFNRALISAGPDAAPGLTVTRGQLSHEWDHLMAKLIVRAPQVHERHRSVEHPEPHPLFSVVDGDVEVWEVVADRGAVPRAAGSVAGSGRRGH